MGHNWEYVLGRNKRYCEQQIDHNSRANHGISITLLRLLPTITLLGIITYYMPMPMLTSEYFRYAD